MRFTKINHRNVNYFKKLFFNDTNFADFSTKIIALYFLKKIIKFQMLLSNVF